VNLSTRLTKTTPEKKYNREAIHYTRRFLFHHIVDNHNAFYGNTAFSFLSKLSKGVFYILHDGNLDFAFQWRNNDFPSASPFKDFYDQPL